MDKTELQLFVLLPDSQLLEAWLCFLTQLQISLSWVKKKNHNNKKKLIFSLHFPLLINLPLTFYIIYTFPKVPRPRKDWPHHPVSTPGPELLLEATAGIGDSTPGWALKAPSSCASGHTYFILFLYLIIFVGKAGRWKAFFIRGGVNREGPQKHLLADSCCCCILCEAEETCPNLMKYNVFICF